METFTSNKSFKVPSERADSETLRNGSPSPAREKNKDIVCPEKGFKLGVEQRVRIYKQNLGGLDVSLPKIYLSKNTRT